MTKKISTSSINAKRGFITAGSSLDGGHRWAVCGWVCVLRRGDHVHRRLLKLPSQQTLPLVECTRLAIAGNDGSVLMCILIAKFDLSVCPPHTHPPTHLHTVVHRAQAVVPMLVQLVAPPQLHQTTPMPHPLPDLSSLLREASQRSRYVSPLVCGTSTKVKVLIVSGLACCVSVEDQCPVRV